MHTTFTRARLLAAGLFALATSSFGRPPGPGAPRPVSAAQRLDVSGPVSEEWVARYNKSVGFRQASYELARAVAVDAQGNVYVTGLSQVAGATAGATDYATVKYSSGGQQLWVAYYNGPANADDEPRAVAVDATGNAYVTGVSAGVGSGADYATVKYSPGGQQLWVARYNGLGNGSDQAWALAVDAAGNAYVTGDSASGGAGGLGDYATIKYAPDGQPLWVARYDGPTSGGDYAQALALDAAGNTYVTGVSYRADNSTSGDFLTVKYAPSGQQLWAATYDGPNSGYDEGRILTVDAQSNAYVTGYSYLDKNSSAGDYLTVKYATGGQQLWTARYNGPADGPDYPQATAVDAAGNVLVTGYSAGVSSGNDYATIKYAAASGQQLWASRYDGPANGADVPQALAVDAAGNAYVTGASAGLGSGNDYLTLKYGPGGEQLWTARYNAPASGGDNAQALALDAAGNVYVTGYSDGPDFSSGIDFVTIKYVQPPTTGSPAPVLTVPGPISVAAQPGQCGASVVLAATATGAPAPAITYATAAGAISSPHVFPVGVTTVTATATNSAGTQKATFSVTVTDREAPVARTKPAIVQLNSAGQATLSAAEVDNGSTDNCRIVARTVRPGTFTCANLGPNTVTLTVTDAQGNTSSAPAVVTVLAASTPAASIAVVPASAVYTGGVATNLYLGYGPQSVTLRASAGGTRYAWTGPTGLSSLTSAAPVFTATAPGQFTYTVTITNPFGCPSTAAVTLTVRDARCGNQNDKVLVCHKGHEICISPAAVTTHLTNHHDQLGSCTAARGASLLAATDDSAEALKPAFEAYPNPFTAATTLRFRALQAGPAQLRVYNALGQVVATLFDQPAAAGQQYQVQLVGAGLPPGLYTCRLLLAGQLHTQRVLLTK